MDLLRMFRKSFGTWYRHNAAGHAAAVSFFALLSVAPILVLAFGVAGVFMNQAFVEHTVLGAFKNSLGEGQTRFIIGLLTTLRMPSHSLGTALVGTLVLLYSATRVMGQLRSSLNAVWGIEIKPGVTVRRYFLSKTFALGIISVFGILLAVFVVTSVIYSFLAAHIPGFTAIAPMIEIGFSLAMTTALTTLLFVVLPDSVIGWPDAVTGAFVTAILITLGKLGFTWCIGFTNFASAYGIAGSVIVFMLWIYVSTQIFFFGAEFTHVYAGSNGNPIGPKAHAQMRPDAAMPVKMKTQTLRSPKRRHLYPDQKM